MSQTPLAPPATLPGPFLDVRQLAKLLHVGVRTIWRWESQNRIPPALRIGSTVRWNFQEIQPILIGGFEQ